ncbi:MAG: phosphatidate cytidylyltransferase [Acidobacteriota bacterium]
MAQRILTALILIPVVLLLIYGCPLWGFLAAATALLGLALWEYSALVGKHGWRLSPASWVVALALPWGAVYRPEFLVMLVLFGVAAVSGWEVLRVRKLEHGLPQWGVNLGGVAILGTPFAVLGRLHPRALDAGLPDPGEHALLLLLLIVWVGDAGAYFVGRAWGKHRFLPHLSPKKTVEGFLAGLFVPVALLLVWPYPPAGASGTARAALGLLVALAGILGDLLESLWKRGAGVKDSSGLLPGHGGILDRIDSLLLAAPVYYAILSLLESPLLAGP